MAACSDHGIYIRSRHIYRKYGNPRRRARCAERHRSRGSTVGWSPCGRDPAPQRIRRRNRRGHRAPMHDGSSRCGRGDIGVTDDAVIASEHRGRAIVNGDARRRDLVGKRRNGRRDADSRRPWRTRAGASGHDRAVIVNLPVPAIDDHPEGIDNECRPGDHDRSLRSLCALAAHIRARRLGNPVSSSDRCSPGSNVHVRRVFLYGLPSVNYGLPSVNAGSGIDVSGGDPDDDGAGVNNYLAVIDNSFASSPNSFASGARQRSPAGCQRQLDGRQRPSARWQRPRAARQRSSGTANRSSAIGHRSPGDWLRAPGVRRRSLWRRRRQNGVWRRANSDWRRGAASRHLRSGGCHRTLAARHRACGLSRQPRTGSHRGPARSQRAPGHQQRSYDA